MYNCIVLNVCEFLNIFIGAPFCFEKYAWTQVVILLSIHTILPTFALQSTLSFFLTLKQSDSYIRSNNN